MSERESVLFANDAFYQAFNDRDGETMASLWAQRVEVACLHPGWPPLFGREVVMQSWRSIFSNPNQPPLQVLQPTVHLLGETALVVCYEAIEGQYLIAANLFVREDDAWRLAHHQSGPTNGKPEAEPPSETPRTRH
jgi:hypothetical protein